MAAFYQVTYVATTEETTWVRADNLEQAKERARIEAREKYPEASRIRIKEAFKWFGSKHMRQVKP